MMAVCSFLGHRHIYGHDVQLRLQAAVNHLVEENDSVEFQIVRASCRERVSSPV